MKWTYASDSRYARNAEGNYFTGLSERMSLNASSLADAAVNFQRKGKKI